MEISLNPSFIQLAQRSLAKFATKPHGDNFCALIEFTYLMINVGGEDKIIKMLKEDNSPNSTKLRKIGEKWSNFKRDLDKFNKVIQRTKPAFDKLSDKTLKEAKKPDYKEFIQYAKRVPLIQDNIFALLVFFTNSSNLKNLGIPSELFKMEEMKGSRLGELGSRQPRTMETKGSDNG